MQNLLLHKLFNEVSFIKNEANIIDNRSLAVLWAPTSSWQPSRKYSLREKSLENTAWKIQLEKYSLEKYSIEKYSLKKYSLEKYSLENYIL